jgi:hypothetical protein
VVIALNGQVPGAVNQLASMVDKINELVAQGPTVEEVSASGALSTTVYLTELSVSGTKAYTLAAPDYAGQRKRIVCVAAASTPAGTLTIADPDDVAGFVCPATFFFDAVGQTLELEATTDLLWRCVRKLRVGNKTLVVGTTTTTGICDMSHVVLSVTGTVASTTTRALPNGAAIGELLMLGVSTAATTPHGDLGGTFVDAKGTTGTTLDDFTLTSDHLLLQWTGTAWLVLSNNSAAVAVV